tara:strand:- start:598 stop:2310 length:1713 start_codon:yes stop_codon:yes gene_type:complete
MSFADGFNSSLSLMLSLERTKLLKEEEESKKRREQELTQDVAGVAPDLADQFETGTTVREAGDVMTLRTQGAQLESSKATTKLRGQQSEMIGIELEGYRDRLATSDATAQANLNTIQLSNEGLEMDNVIKSKGIKNQQDYDNSKLSLDIFGGLLAHANDPVFMESKGTSAYDLVVQGFAEQANSLDRAGAVDLLSMLDKDYAKNMLALEPLFKALQSGAELENVNLADYNTELNKMLDIRKNEFIGSTFKKADGTKAKITGLNIDFNSLEGVSGSERSGGNVLIKGTFKLDDGTEVLSYIPDSSRAVISEAQESTDAFSISLGDLMDTASASRSIIQTALNPNNVAIFQVAADVAERKRNLYERDPNKLANINAQAIETFGVYSNRFSQQLQLDSNLPSEIKYIGSNDPERESESIRKLATKYNFTDDVDILSRDEAEDLGIDVEEGATYYRYKRDENGGLIKSVRQSLVDQNVPSVDEIANGLKAGTPFEKTKVETRVQQTYTIGGVTVNRTDALSTVLPQIKQANPQIPAEDIDAYIEAARAAYRDRGQGELSEQAILDLLSRYPLLR